MTESTLSAEQIGKSRSLLLEGWELDLGVVDSLCDQAIEAITLRTTLAAEIERRELAERALADAQECIEQKDVALLRGADAMTKDAEFIRSLKAELAKLRAPVDLPKIIKDFDAFLNEPPQYEDKRMVRDYRHAAYQKWQPVVECGLLLAAQVRERDGRIAVLIESLTRIRDGVPAHHEGSLIIEHYDGDGNFTGTESVDPISVIQSMVGIADAAITQPREKQS